jgi:deoxycytidine triphosphate deaminase
MFTIGEFKGNITITLKQSEDDPYGFTFGLTKARLILEHIEDIKKFYEENKDKAKSRKKPGEAAG